jgi:hypothetical protein
LDDASAVLHQMDKLVTANTKTMGALGARTMVLGKFLDAALPCLTTGQRVEVSESFRRGIEDAMCQMDDVVLPAEYHSAVLDLTNAIFAALAKQSAACK